MHNRQIQPVREASQHMHQLREELGNARRDLRDAEAALGAEQATINAFRMQCRLKLGEWIDDLLDLRSEKQTLLTRLQLEQQAVDYGIEYDDDAPFWQDAAWSEPEINSAEAIDPTLLNELAGTENDRNAEKRLYRELARRFHPDLSVGTAERAYSTSIMATINNAYANHDMQTLRELAGELDPATVAAYSGGETREIRQLRQAILSCKRRQRRAAQQLKALRRENTAQLWRRAQQLEADGLAWWDEVRQQLQNEIQRYRSDIATLENQLSSFS
ncbi:MAG: J domain-containing protein [Anaerolineae bacterium]|nr:J domain-containing protein [Anaerolineae bacterium]